MYRHRSRVDEAAMFSINIFQGYPVCAMNNRQKSSVDAAWSSKLSGKISRMENIWR